jgi:hypothetical protein
MSEAANYAYQMFENSKEKAFYVKMTVACSCLPLALSSLPPFICCAER